MITEIIVGVLSLIGTLVGAYLANKKQTALIAYRIEQLEKKQDKHNTLIERMYACEADIRVLEERMDNYEGNSN